MNNELKIINNVSKKSSVLVAVSGGVDSSTSLYLLKEQGFSVKAIHFVFVSEKNVKKVKEVCKKLSVKLAVVDLRKEFKEKVIDGFLDQYESGLTPNPCVFCNRFMKFDQLIKWANKLNCEYIATGHYAKISDFRNYQFLNIKCQKKYQNSNTKLIMAAKDEKKDQSYFLWNLKSVWLKRMVFPLGYIKKEKTKEIAHGINLGFEGQKESQEICFCPEKNIKNYLKNNLPKQKKGKIKNIESTILGEHDGLAYYTIGQRSGLPNIKNNTPNSSPKYVIKKDHKKNELIVGRESLLFKNEVKAFKTNLFVSIQEIKRTSLEKKLYAKIRYGHKIEKIEVLEISKTNILARFYKKQRAITPGQSIVFYNHKKQVLGGGIIK